MEVFVLCVWGGGDREWRLKPLKEKRGVWETKLKAILRYMEIQVVM